MIAIHTIIINKSECTVKDIDKISQVIMQYKKFPSLQKFDQTYQYCNIPKNKFEKGSFHRKKVNNCITIVFGRLKPQNIHLAGSGLFDSIKHGLQRVRDMFKPRTDSYNDKSQKTLQLYGNEPITSMYIMRAPIKSMVDTLLNFLSLGKWNEIKEKNNYDKFYHLSLVCEVGHRKIIVEKNEQPNISTGFAHEEDSEIFHIDMHGKILTLSGLLENTRKLIGDTQFFVYDAFRGQNCQNFIDNILKSNDLLTPEAHAWLFQPIEKIVEDLPEYVPHVSKALTDIANVANKLTGGYEEQIGQILDHQLHKALHQSSRK
jgi:hypothetical protein